MSRYLAFVCKERKYAKCSAYAGSIVLALIPPSTYAPVVFGRGNDVSAEELLNLLRNTKITTQIGPNNLSLALFGMLLRV